MLSFISICKISPNLPAFISCIFKQQEIQATTTTKKPQPCTLSSSSKMPNHVIDNSSGFKLSLSQRMKTEGRGHLWWFTKSLLCQLSVGRVILVTKSCPLCQLKTSNTTHRGNTDPYNYWWYRSSRLLMGKGMSGSKRILRNTAGRTPKNFLVSPYLRTVVHYTLLTKVSQSQTLSEQLWVIYNSGKNTGNYCLLPQSL